MRVIRKSLRAVEFAILLSLMQMGSSPASGQEASPLPSRAAMNALLDSLEQVALTAGNPDERRTAVIAVASPGRIWFAAQSRTGAPLPEVRYPGIVDRLARIYRQSEDYGVRSAIVDLMPLQTERPEAIDFLEEVAQESGPEHAGKEWPIPFKAVNALLHMPPEGQAALERLHAADLVRDPWARARLDRLARRGYRDPKR